MFMKDKAEGMRGGQRAQTSTEKNLLDSENPKEK